jgi:hypothetical protein
VRLVPCNVAAIVEREAAAFRDTSQIRITSKVAIDTVVLADDVELGPGVPEPVRERAPLRPLDRHRHRPRRRQLRAHRACG